MWLYFFEVKIMNLRFFKIDKVEKNSIEGMQVASPISCLICNCILSNCGKCDAICENCYDILKYDKLKIKEIRKIIKL